MIASEPIGSGQGLSKRSSSLRRRPVVKAFLLALALTLVGVVPANAATRYSRSFDVRDLRLEEGQALGVSLHPTAVPIEVSSSHSKLEVCPSGWPSFAGFLECTRLGRDGKLTLPSTLDPNFHLGIRIQGIDGTPVRVKRLRITYEPGDGYFMFEPPPVPGGARAPALIVTPEERDSIGVGPYFLRGTESEDETTSMTPAVRQSGARISEGGEPTNGRTEKTFGPVKLEKAVRIVVRNPSDEERRVAFYVDWD